MKKLFNIFTNKHNFEWVSFIIICLLILSLGIAIGIIIYYFLFWAIIGFIMCII